MYLSVLKYSSCSFFFFLLFLGFILFILFIYSWLCWVLISGRGLSLVAASGGHSSSWRAGLPLSQPLLLRSTGSRRAGSVVVAHGPSCSVACGNLPRPGLEPVSPALAGRFSTTGPPGKPPHLILFKNSFSLSVENLFVPFVYLKHGYNSRLKTLSTDSNIWVISLLAFDCLFPWEMVILSLFFCMK